MQEYHNVKCPSKAEVNDIHYFPIFYKSNDFITEDEVSQT